MADSQEAGQGLPLDSYERVICLCRTFMQLDNQYLNTGNLLHLDESIHAGKEALLASSVDCPAPLPVLHSLGIRLQTRYAATSSEEDLDESIQVGREALNIAVEGHPYRPVIVYSLGIALKNKYLRTGALETLLESIGIQQQVIESIPRDSPDMPGLVGSLANSIGGKYVRFGVAEDLEKTIQLITEALYLAPENHIDRVGWISNLGARFRDKFLRTGLTTDLDEAIETMQRAANLVPEGHPIKATTLSNLGLGLIDRYRQADSMADLDAAIDFMRVAVETTPDNQVDWITYSSNLGGALVDRYERTAAVTDAREALRFLQDASDASRRDSQARIILLSKLAVALRQIYLKSGSTSDLEESLQMSRRALQETPEDDPNWAVAANNLSLALGDVHARNDTVADLEESIRIGRAALDATPKDLPLWPQRASKLSIRLGERSSKLGATRDDSAVQSGQESLNATHEHHSRRAHRLNNLGMQFRERYRRTGSMADIDESIKACKDAVQAISDDSPNRAMWFSSLSASLLEKHLRSESLDDLDESIGRPLAVARLPKQHWPLLGIEFQRTKAESDIEESIQSIRRAISVTQLDHAALPSFLFNLGSSLHNRYKYNTGPGALPDLDEAIDLGRQAVAATSSNKSGYVATGVGTDLDEAISYQEGTLNECDARSIDRVTAGREIIRCCAIRAEWQRAYEAAKVAIPIVSKLTIRSLEISDKHYQLGQIAGLASDAAAVALHAGKLPLVALGFLEQGRGVLATSLEELRIDLLKLKEIYPDLAEQFVRLRDELELPISRESSPLSVEGGTFSQQAQATRRFETGIKFDNLITEIRSMSGFEEFLAAPNEGAVRSAAKDGPIVVINISDYRCDAILIEPHVVRSIPLPDLSTADITSRTLIGNPGGPKALKWLWDTVTKPALTELGFTQPQFCRDELATYMVDSHRFPIHAAGYHYKGSCQTVLDRVMSSYASSVKAMIYSRERPRMKSSDSMQVVLVAMENTPEHTSLPFTVEEVAGVHDVCASMASKVIEPAPNKKSIMASLSDCDIFHFAGHGHSDSMIPAQSYLCLQDWKTDQLTVETLLATNIRQRSPFLAYLSACGTGQIRDDKSWDESIHLISGFQLAGFRNVIGTLWEVNDQLSADMARITYEGLKRWGMVDRSVCLALHCASIKLRDRWLDKLQECKHTSRLANPPFGTDEQLDANNASVGADERQRFPRDIIPVKEEEDQWPEPANWVPYICYSV
ncbi:unnamed protein product [Clonostachys solani]|uniref:CHAT domain-containing protein n=1 Tax=Clonostachys solani TaxID=160281 RepID=A0A9P0ENJ6_9HYPO|nr:unnamed protein product [Clonostachys solani]